MPDAEGLPPLSGAQLEVMHAVWDRGEATVSDVWAALAARKRVARNTVLTVMDRLADKGWLVRRVAGPAHHFSAAVPRAEALGRAVKQLVDAAFAGSAEGLVLALLDGRGVTDDEARRIEQLIAFARKKGGAT